MDAEQQHGFIKNLISSETKDTIFELKSVIEKQRNLNDLSNEYLLNYITKYQEEIENVETISTNNDKKDCMRGQDILIFIKLILENKLDFSNRLEGTRSVLEQWKKTRAYKNDEFSTEFREKGNSFLRTGELNHALHFYNEAILFGKFVTVPKNC